MREPYTDFQLVEEEASDFVDRANKKNRNDFYWTFHFPGNDFWSTTVRSQLIFSDFTELDETVLSLQNFFIAEEEDVRALWKAAQAEVKKRAKQRVVDEDNTERIKKNQEERARVHKWYKENKELTDFKLIIGAYILFASGVPLKNTERPETKTPAHKRIRERAIQAEAVSKDPEYPKEIRDQFLIQAVADRKKVDEEDGTAEMKSVLSKIADKECWPYGGKSIYDLYDMLPDGDNLKTIDDIVANIDHIVVNVELPPSVGAPAAAPPRSPPSYRTLPLMGSPPTNASSPSRSPLHKKVQNSPQLKNKDPNHVVEETFKFLKGAVALRRHHKIREKRWKYSL